MDTKKFNSGENARGGKNNTKTILTASGLSAVAGATGAAIAFKFTTRPEKTEEEITEVDTPVVDEHQEEQQPNNQQPNNQQPQQSPAQSPDNDISAPQPIDSTGGTGESTPTQPTENDVVQNTSDDDIDPDAIAQQIAGSSEIDNTDIDVPTIITVDNMDIAYGPDGSEFTVAMIHTPDGGNYMLADIDGDGIFSDVFDLDGNYVCAAEGNLTLSDLEEAATPDGTYMAYDENAPIGEDPTNDIVATDTHHNETSMPDTDLAAEDEIVDIDDVLAQLLENNEESLEIVVVDDPNNDDSDDLVFDDSDDDDSIDEYDDLDDDEA